MREREREREKERKREGEKEVSIFYSPTAMLSYMYVCTSISLKEWCWYFV